MMMMMMMMMMLVDSSPLDDECVVDRKLYWIHNINKDYETSGQFITLYQKLREDEERFWRNFRMSSSNIQVGVCLYGDTCTSVWHVEIGGPG